MYSGNQTPVTGHKIKKPKDGDFAAVTDQLGPGSHTLYQDINLEQGTSHTLSFYLYYENQAASFHTAGTLDPEAIRNQQTAG